MLAPAFIILFPAIILFFFLFKFIFPISNSGRIIHNNWLLKTYRSRVKKNVNTTAHRTEKNIFQYLLLQPRCICMSSTVTSSKQNSLPILLSLQATANSSDKNVSQQPRTANAFVFLTAREIIYCKLIMLAQLTHSRWQGT
jgi:hypothetical protein